MLIGNIINENLRLFKAAIAHVPFVDVQTLCWDVKPCLLPPGEFKEWEPKEKAYLIT